MIPGGKFKTQLLTTEGYTDDDLEVARKEGHLADIVDNQLDVVEEHGGKNMWGDNIAPWFFNTHFSGAGNGEAAIGSMYLHFVGLMYGPDTEVSYTELWDGGYWHGTIHDYSYNIGGSAKAGAKRFEEDSIDGWTSWSDPDREALWFRDRWLWTPTQAIYNGIRSIGIHWSHSPTATGDAFELGRFGRVRLKDSNGVPVAINKTRYHCFMVEYTFAIVASV
jgi:hypothetical protein